MDSENILQEIRTRHGFIRSASVTMLSCGRYTNILEDYRDDYDFEFGSTFHLHKEFFMKIHLRNNILRMYDRSGNKRKEYIEEKRIGGCHRSPFINNSPRFFNGKRNIQNNVYGYFKIAHPSGYFGYIKKEYYDGRNNLLKITRGYFSRNYYLNERQQKENHTNINKIMKVRMMK
jgi:hypothetical protein